MGATQPAMRLLLPPPQATDAASPWHAGELALQRSVGVVAHMDNAGRNFVRPCMPEQHRQFFPLLPFVVIGAVDRAGDVWATMRAGRPGFLHSPDPLRLAIASARDGADPADAGMEEGDAIGLLGIDLATRRRNRLNGTVRRQGRGAADAEADAGGFTLAVGQSFGNCPRYISTRAYAFTRDPALQSPLPPESGGALDERARRIIAAADSFFVASYIEGHDSKSGTRQVDVSHRGGLAGFVRVGDDGVLTVPDFSGNLFFNTLGNFLLNPRAGLLFVDHATGDLLQMAGEAEVVIDSPEIAAFQGAERLWRFTPRRVVFRPQGLPLRWSTDADGAAPSSLMTGTWGEAEARLQAAARATQWRPFRVARTVEESAVIRSLWLEPADGAARVPHLAGQHVPLRVVPHAADQKALVRSYTLSAAPSDGAYRISVKREGAASQQLHTLRVGDTVELRGPAGGFTIDAAQRRPAVLLAAGVGITPLLAMLRHIVFEGQRTRHLRPTWLFQSARSVVERAFGDEIDALVAAARDQVHRVRVLGTADGAEQGEDYEAEGRIDMALLQATLPFGDYDFYLCGPASFMQAMYDGLRGLNVADARIHAEAFGPSGLQRTPAPGGTAKAGGEVGGRTHGEAHGAQGAAAPATNSVPIVFARSGKEARWNPGDGSLLEVAEARGLAPAFGCRAGRCGTCKAKLLEGAVAYTAEPTAERDEGEVLVCCAVPAVAKEGESARLVLAL
ncbi:MAG: pyridoxamine 5'-phosphate oxidase family protein [Pseudomonadota bacterium]